MVQLRLQIPWQHGWGCRLAPSLPRRRRSCSPPITACRLNAPPVVLSLQPFGVQAAMPSAVQLAGRLHQKLGRLVALDGERGSAVSARAATFAALDALEGALERQPAGPFSAELCR